MNYQEQLARQRLGYECNPAAYYVAAVVIAAASTAYTIDAQRKQASAQEEFQNIQTASAKKGARAQQEAVRDGQAQEAESNARTLETARLTNQKASANAITSLGESGGTSHTADALLAEYNMQLGQYREAVRRQTSFSNDSTEARIEAIGMGASNTISNVNRPIDLPNYAAAGITFAGQALEGYNTYRQDTASKTSTGKKTA